MFNLAHHHCHPFTDSYKGFICAELKQFLTARKSDTLILWRACLLVVPTGFDLRTYNIGTLQRNPCCCAYFLFIKISLITPVSNKVLGSSNNLLNLTVHRVTRCLFETSTEFAGVKVKTKIKKTCWLLQTTKCKN